MSRNEILLSLVAVCLCLTGPAGAIDTYTETFDAFPVGQPVGNDADWYGGPNVNAAGGVAGSQGLDASGTPFYWTAHPFAWDGSQFNSYTGGLDFQTNASAAFDDSRVGFYYGALGTSSSNVMSVQMDPGGSGMNIEGYWDGVGVADVRPSIVNLTGLLTANSWYRFEATFTKAAIPNEPIIDVSLHSLDGAGNVTGLIASATLDTATLPAGDRPHTKYFSGTVYPAYKNFAGGNYADNALAIIDDDTPPPPPPAPLIATCYFDEAPVGTQNWTPGVGDEDLGFSTTLIAGTPYTLGVYDSGTSPWRYRMRTCEAEVEMDTVDLTLMQDVKVAIDVLIANTSYEADDYFLVTLTNGVDTIDVAREQGTLAGLTKDSWMHYEVAVPDDWTEATMVFSSSSNSSADAEIVNFDNIEFRGNEIPEPMTVSLLALGGLGLIRRRRK